MTKRLDVSYTHNLFRDAQQVDQEDLALEQDRDVQTDAAIVNNFFGSGILLSTPQTEVLFDSDNLTASQAALAASNNFDGRGIDVHQQPTDSTLGTQLEIELTDSNVVGRFSVKVAIVGLSFDNTLQMDRFYFYRNEKQYTSKHYKQILSVFFSDFKGNTVCSRNNGGRIVIREAQSFQLSRDPIMSEQTVEPDIFWRDWKVPALSDNVFDLIQDGIGAEYDADSLDINITGRPNKRLLTEDVTAQVGQKFLAKTDNIQKITLLLGVERDDSETIDDIYDWNGDIVISVYALQSSVSCPSDIVPELAIDFEPKNQPIVQLSFSYDTLRDAGYVLNDVLQPVDFVFSGTKLGNPSKSTIVPGNYYAFTVKRSGNPTIGNIIIGVGNNRDEENRATAFNTVWVDIPEESLWYQIWTDAAKIASGQGYDAGNGIQYDKTTLDEETGATIDYEVRYLPFVDTGYSTTNNGIVQAVLQESIQDQDQRTGNNVYSRKKFVPSFSFLKNSDLSGLQDVSEPLVVGAAFDLNPKLNPTLEKVQEYPGAAIGDTYIIINPDADLLNLNLVGSKLIPNVDGSADYKIVKTNYCRDYYGDVDGNGDINQSDVLRATELIGESIHYTATQEKIRDGEITLLELLRADVDGDGYVTSDDLDELTQYVNRQVNSFTAGTYFTHLTLTVQQSIGRYDGYFDCTDGYVRLDGYGGTNIVSSDSLSIDELTYDGYNSTPIIQLDSVYTAVPFESVTYQIKPLPFWADYLLKFKTDTKLVPCNFSYNEGVTQYSCVPEIEELCEDRNDLEPSFDSGRNDFFIPDNLLIGKGQILNQDGSHHKVDFEVFTVILELPTDALSNVNINIFEKCIRDRGDGLNTIGKRCARYADCSTVQLEDLALGRVRFNVSLQSFVKNNDGYDEGSGSFVVIVDEQIGVSIDQSTGILTIYAKNLEEDNVYQSLVTKIQVIAYLKKGGFNNEVLTITSSEIEGLTS